jgi:hypothetical protein
VKVISDQISGIRKKEKDNAEAQRTLRFAERIKRQGNAEFAEERTQRSQRRTREGRRSEKRNWETGKIM